MTPKKNPNIIFNIPISNVPPEKYSKVTLLLEQIKYIHNEIISIQNSFLAMIYIPLAFLGVMIYYAYTNNVIFLILPFLFFWCLYNLMKYSMKIYGLDAYTRYLEESINSICGEPCFLWQSHLINCNGYHIWGILGQLPCFLAVGIFLIHKFLCTFFATPFSTIGWILLYLLAAEVILLLIMLFFTARHYYAVLKKIKKIKTEL